MPFLTIYSTIFYRKFAVTIWCCYFLQTGWGSRCDETRNRLLHPSRESRSRQ